jgi:hypothetical protein
VPDADGHAGRAVRPPFAGTAPRAALRPGRDPWPSPGAAGGLSMERDPSTGRKTG